MTTTKRVGGLQSFGLWRVCFDLRIACRKPAEVRRVRFNHRKACNKFAELWKVRFDTCSVCRRFADLSRARFEHTKRVRGLQKFVE